AGVQFYSPILSYFQSPINAGMAAMLLGIIITPIIAGIAPSKDKDRVDKIFECYNKKHTVSSKHSIDED
ncbi:MAG: sodium:solute symporter, partial [Ruminococcus sp.]|nr:sodium:solute symporter [Ruminococcus sp.]